MSTTTLQCPDCRIALDREVYRRVTLDVCADCGGIWCDCGELQQLLGEGVLALTELEDHVRPRANRSFTRSESRGCPICRLPLHRYRFQLSSPIELDTCESCHGVWVEDGELEEIRAWLERETETTVPDTHAAVREIVPTAATNARDT